MYETNVASCRIWDALGFKRIGRVKGCGNLRSNPDELIDAIIYGRDLGPDGEDYVSEERFDKIRYYLKHGKYPNGADRAEKSRLRSAATHYKLLPAENGDTREDSERLMLKDKEVVSDPQRQYEIARQIHSLQHGGINKTTATIAEKYHWVRIKETVSLVIKNCPDCKETAPRPPVVRPSASKTSEYPGQGRRPAPPDNNMIDQLIHFDGNTSTSAEHTQPLSSTRGSQLAGSQQEQNLAPVAHMRPLDDSYGIPLDPQIMESEHSSLHDFAEGMRRVAEFGRSGHDPSAQFDINMNAGDAVLPQQPDTRMATERHVRQGDEPSAYRDSHGVLHNTAMDSRKENIEMLDQFDTAPHDQ